MESIWFYIGLFSAFILGYSVCLIFVSGSKSDLEMEIIQHKIEVETLQTEAKLLREANEELMGQLNLCRNQLTNVLRAKQ